MNFISFDGTNQHFCNQNINAMKTHEQQHQERRASQRNVILEHLKKGYTLNIHQARKLCECENLKGRIHELRKDHDIGGKMIYLDGGKKYMDYYHRPSYIKRQIFLWLRTGKGITLESARYMFDEKITDVLFRDIIADLEKKYPIESDGYGRFTMNLNVPIEI